MITKNIANGVLLGASLILPCAAMAEGYQVNTISARQLGMGHTGIAMKLGSESQFFNPAGMAFMESQVEASANITAVGPSATATIAGQKYHTDNKVSTPIGIFGAYSILDNLKAGLCFYTPYGSSINWTDNWPGATLNQSVKLAAYTVQPTLAWRILPNLSIGAGLTISWGSVNLNKGLVSAAELNTVLGAQGLPTVPSEITPASASLDGTASVVCGVNLGAMYDISDHVTAGINWRSKSMMKVKAGTTQVNYAIENPLIKDMIAQRLDGISKTDFSSEMPCPATLGFGGSWHNSKLIVDVETQLTFWKTYKYLDIEFVGLPEMNQHLEKNYHNSWLVRGGVEWKTTDRLDLRAGLMVDFSPCDKEYYNPETPGMTKIEPTVGLTFRPVDHLAINAGFMYIVGAGIKDATYTSDNVLLPGTTVFKADYNLHALVGSVGLALSF